MKGVNVRVCLKQINRLKAVGTIAKMTLRHQQQASAITRRSDNLFELNYVLMVQLLQNFNFTYCSYWELQKRKKQNIILISFFIIKIKIKKGILGNNILLLSHCPCEFSSKQQFHRSLFPWPCKLDCNKVYSLVTKLN